MSPQSREPLGGSWVLLSRVISRVTIHITHIRGLVTPPITTHEPPSTNPTPQAGDACEPYRLASASRHNAADDEGAASGFGNPSARDEGLRVFLKP